MLAKISEIEIAESNHKKTHTIFNAVNAKKWHCPMMPMEDSKVF